MTDRLDPDRIRQAMSAASAALLDSLDVHDVVPSTNTWLMQQPRHERGRFRAALAEHQTDGRGRRNRRWISPPKGGVCLSLSYTFDRSPSNLSCVTLAAGVAAMQALGKLGMPGVKLKWPNDLYAGDAKLGGILTDAQSASGGWLTVITGVGLNVDIVRDRQAAPELDQIDYSVTDLHAHMETVPERSTIAGALLDRLIVAFRKFEEGGLEPFRADWNGNDWLKGRVVSVSMPDGTVTGTADGIDANGALRIRTEHGRRRVFTGDVHVQPHKVA